MNPYQVQYLDYKDQHDTTTRFDWKCLHEYDAREDAIGRSLKSAECHISKRHELTNKYSFAVPTDEAINKIASLAPIIEIGAGTGYWASLIAAAGAEIIAFDIAPIGSKNKNEWAFNRSHFKVEEGTEEWVSVFPDHTLMLCWPPMDDTATKAVLNTTKDPFIYIGEWHGCTGDDYFQEYLEAHCNVVEVISLPQWPAIHDAMFILERKG